MLLDIAQLGQPVLRQVAVEVPPERIAHQPFQELLGDMLETLEEHKGAGLAAPQVFAGLRVFLAAIVPPEYEDEMPGVEVFINPRVTPLSQETVLAWEGCLSFPELLVRVARYTSVRIDYLNAQGEPSAVELEGFPARVVQHENDHLDGILTIDRAASTRHVVKASEIKDVIDAAHDAE